MIMSTTISVEEWEEQYTPMRNHMNPEASWNGTMFETYGDEVKFIYDFDSTHIWTYCDGDDGGTYLVSGRHYVNRIGYFITEVPVPFDDLIEVMVSPPDDEEISWGELAELTHATQVKRFGWCSCEEQENFPYDDCPKEVK